MKAVPMKPGFTQGTPRVHESSMATVVFLPANN